MYHLDRDYANLFEKVKYTGKTLTLNADIGEMVFTHSDGTKEFYKSEKIVFHYPSEHGLTING